MLRLQARNDDLARELLERVRLEGLRVRDQVVDDSLRREGVASGDLVGTGKEGLVAFDGVDGVETGVLKALVTRADLNACAVVDASAPKLLRRTGEDAPIEYTLGSAKTEAYSVMRSKAGGLGVMRYLIMQAKAVC